VEDSRILVLDREEFLKLAEGFSAFRGYFEGHLAEEGLAMPEPPRDAAE